MYVPDRLVLQFHITERCNLRCGHCYQEGSPAVDPSWDQLVSVIEQYKQLLDYWQGITGKRIPGHVNLTGGEVFLRRDFFDFLAFLNDQSNYFSYAILTNGLLCTSEVCSRLQKLKPKFVQLSLDGSAEMHDALRGPTTFSLTIAALRRLKEKGIFTMVAFTAGAQNYRDFPAVVRAARSAGADKIWADRLIPVGSRGGMQESLSPAQCREFFSLMVAARRAKRWWGLRDSMVSMNRALQFLHGGGEPYTCRAGDSLLAVLPSGDLLPCRRMPIVVGNLFRSTLTELYYNSNLLYLLREKGRVARGCEGCEYRLTCRGGLRCLSFTLRGDPFLADPGCPLAREKSNAKGLG